MLWTKHHVCRVILAPIGVQQSTFWLHFLVERRTGIGRHDVEPGALQMFRFNPIDSRFENIFAVMIEPEHKAALHLSAVAMQSFDAVRAVFGARTLIFRIGDVVVL